MKSKSLWPKSPFFFTFFILAALAGCHQGERHPGSATDQLEPLGEYSGQELPEQILGLSGVPLFFISPELSPQVPEPGSYFLLLAPQDPQRAVLVSLPDEAPEALASRSSERHELDGTTKLLSSPGVGEFVKDNYEIELASDDSGNLILIQASRLEISEEQAELDEEEDL